MRDRDTMKKNNEQMTQANMNEWCRRQIREHPPSTNASKFGAKIGSDLWRERECIHRDAEILV